MTEAVRCGWPLWNKTVHVLWIKITSLNHFYITKVRTVICLRVDAPVSVSICCHLSGQLVHTSCFRLSGSLDVRSLCRLTDENSCRESQHQSIIIYSVNVFCSFDIFHLKSGTVTLTVNVSSHLCVVASGCGGSEAARLRLGPHRQCLWCSSGAAGWGERRESGGSYGNPCGPVGAPASPATPGQLWQGRDEGGGKGWQGSWGRSYRPGDGRSRHRREMEAPWMQRRRKLSV